MWKRVAVKVLPSTNTTRKGQRIKLTWLCRPRNETQETPCILALVPFMKMVVENENFQPGNRFWIKNVQVSIWMFEWDQRYILRHIFTNLLYKHHGSTLTVCLPEKVKLLWQLQSTLDPIVEILRQECATAAYNWWKCIQTFLKTTQ